MEQNQSENVETLIKKELKLTHTPDQMKHKVYIYKVYTLIATLFMCAFSHAQLTPEFTSNITSGCAPLSISFTNQSTGGATGFTWDLGNGNFSSLENPGAIYSIPGTYEVKLIITDGTDSDSITKPAYITVYAPPVADFSVTDTIGCAPFDPSFTDLSAEGDTTISSWLWSFGDGGASTNPSPLYNYTTAGTWDVLLQVTDLNGCTHSTSFTDLVDVQSVSANFFVDSFFCSPPYIANFTNASSGIDLTYNWDFGNGDNSTVENPSSTYNSMGSFAVQLTIEDTLGCTDDITKFVVGQNVQIDFDFDITCSGNSITGTFTDNSPATTSNWLWDFGNGHFSNSQSPVHSFTNYPDTIWYIADIGSNCTDTVFNVYDSMTTSFVTDTPTCANAAAYNFTSSASGDGSPYSYSWDFGGTGTSTDENPNYNFPVNTDTVDTYYNVTLTTTNSNGCSSTFSDSVVVMNPPSAFFNLSTYMGCTPLTIQFGDASSGANINSWNWDFGDGNTSTLENPSHTFTDTGLFDIQLIIQNTIGCSDTILFSDTVRTGIAPDSADFLMPADTFCFGQMYTLVSQAGFSDPAYQIDAWCWDLNAQPSQGIECDCDSAVASNPIYCDTNAIYTPGDVDQTLTTTTLNGETVCINTFEPIAGEDTVSLTVYNNGCPTTSFQPVFIRNTMACIGIISFDTTCGPYGSCGDTVRLGFFDASTNADSISDFRVVYRETGDTLLEWADITDTLFYTFNLPGNYDIYQTAHNDDGCENATMRTFTLDSASIGFDILEDTICLNAGGISFTDTSFSANGTLSSYMWIFGDGDTLTGVLPGNTTITGADSHSGRTSGTYLAPIHDYQDTGNYEVQFLCTFSTLSLMNEDGIDTPVLCDFNFVDTIYMHGIAPYLSADTTLGCRGLSVSFNDSIISSSPVTELIWNYGDGSGNDTTFTPLHDFNIPGAFDITLTASNAFGCQESFTFDDLVYISTPTPAFSGDTSLCQNTIGTFTNSSTGDGTLSYVWDFDIGDSSTITSPSYLFDSVGSFDIALTVIDSLGCDSTLINTGYTIVHELPVAGFEVDSSSATCPPLPVNFTDTSSTTISNIMWDFGDNTTSSNSNPFHNYTTTGEYDITLIVENIFGCTDTIVDSSAIQIGGPTGTGFFAGDSGCTDHSSTFYATTQNATQYTWDFGDGNISNQFADTIEHTYITPGTFNPQLIIEDINNCQFVVPIAGQILVDENIPSFTMSDTILCDIDTVHFTNTSTTFFGATYSWDLGEGDLSSLTSPSKYYDTTRSYLITLTSTSDFCERDTTVALHIFEAPDLTSSINDTLVCVPFDLEVELQNTNSDVTITDWNWIIEQDTFPTNVTTYSFPNSGTYNFSYLVNYGNDNCSFDSSFSLIVMDWVEASFNTSHTDIWIGNAEMVFTNTSQYDETWSWDFGNGDGDLNEDAYYTYTEPGDYTVTLIADNLAGCADTASIDLIVHPISDLTVPNIFSPNNDYKNDIFDVRAEGIESFEGYIFNRWGMELYRWKNTKGGWDGRFTDGTEAPEGTYYYIIDVVGFDGEVHQKQGHFQLVR